MIGASNLTTISFYQLASIVQVAVRGGRPIAAIPPDYKLLDYDPHKQVYLYANMRLSNDSFIDNQGGMGKARASFIGAEDCAELKSYPSQADLRQSTGSEAPEAIVRGLSVVLPSEAISSPPGLVTHTSSSVRFYLTCSYVLTCLRGLT